MERNVIILDGKKIAAEVRAELAVQMVQTLLDDYGFFFASHLTMGIVARAGVEGLVPHPSDYYEITAELTAE